MTAQILLLVEDERLILNLLDDALTEAGYDVVVAGDGADAVRELGENANRFRGIITDINLGAGPDGWEIGHRARELSPRVQIVYVTGDRGHEWASKGVPNSLIVSKPFAPAQVVTAISTLLVQEDTRRGGQLN